MMEPRPFAELMVGLPELPDRSTARTDALPRPELPALPFEEITARLHCCDPSMGYEAWRDLAGALHATPCAVPHFDKRALFVAWSQSGTNYTSDEAAEAVYDTMPPKPDGIGAGTFIRATDKAGYAGPTVAHGPSIEQGPLADAVKALAISEGAVASSSDGYPPSLSARELAHGDFPRPAWLIEHLVLEGHVNLLIGDGKVGKTFAVLHMAVAIAAGLELWGLKCLQASVLIVLAEDDAGETKARVEAVCAALGVALEALPIQFWCLPSEDLILARVTDNGGVTPGPFLEPLLAKVVATGARCVFLDPLTDFAELDESKRLAANAYCKKVLGPFSHKLGVTVVQTGHTSKASMQDGSVVSGSTAWKNAVRNVLSMERPKDAPPGSRERTLRNAWTNYGDEHELKLRLAGGVLHLAGDDVPDTDLAAAREALIQAVVGVAIKAAENGKPLNGNTRRLAEVQLNEIRALIGRTPTKDEVKEALDAAVWLKRLSCLTPSRHRKAGYYPPDEQAIDLAVKAKRAARADAVKLGFLPPSEAGQ